ncbi:MAG: CPBP family intramembrane metalloprotease [Hyphomicrobiaceae bacterium]|nr:CPBP family intramembrane metalloprotease [Hyphomicrobiaceae bacterium]
MIAIYVVAPLGAYALVYEVGVPLLGVLGPVFMAFVLVLSLDRTFRWRDLFFTPVVRAELSSIASLFVVLGSVIVGIAYFLHPAQFFGFPRREPSLWLAVMALYPLVSVTAQEIMFRVLFAHRYLKLFRGNFIFAIVVNAVLFAYSHLIFESWVTIFVSFAGGLIFAYRYFTYRSFWGVCLEHALYGNLIFTVGLGRYFFTGVPFG